MVIYQVAVCRCMLAPIIVVGVGPTKQLPKQMSCNVYHECKARVALWATQDVSI